jgi:hypothetical protein
VLYRDVGIILADGKHDHAAAVRALRQALRAHREIPIPDAYRSAEVDAAYDEARQAELGFTPVRPPAPVEVAAAAPAETGTTNWGQGGSSRQVLLHAVATLRTGNLDAFNSTGLGLFGVQGAVTYVARNGIAVGGLTRVDYKWLLQNGQDWGAWGMSGTFGGVFGRSNLTTFHYVLGGIGFEHWPDVGKAGLAFHALYGASLGGFGLGVGVDAFLTTIGMPPYYSQDVFEVLCGVHLGFADLL